MARTKVETFMSQLARVKELRNEARTQPAERRFKWERSLVKGASPDEAMLRHGFNDEAKKGKARTDGTKPPVDLPRERAKIKKARNENR